MLKKTVQFEDFNGKVVTEDLYFHLTTPEVTKLNMKCGGDITTYAEKLTAKGDGEEMIGFLEMMILSAYGVKSDDGKRFLKTPKVREEFEYSAAYAQLFEEILTNPEQAKLFGQGLMQGANAANANADKAKLIADHQTTLHTV